MSAQTKLLLTTLKANGIYVEVTAVTLRKKKNLQAGDSQMQFQMLRSQSLYCKETWWIRSEKVTNSKYDAREYSRTKETLWGDTDRIDLGHRNSLPWPGIMTSYARDRREDVLRENLLGKLIKFFLKCYPNEIPKQARQICKPKIK